MKSSRVFSFFIFLAFLSVIAVSYSMTKPFTSDFGNATNKNIETIDFQKEPSLSTSKSLIYNSGTLYMALKQYTKKKKCHAYVSLFVNDHPLKQFFVNNKESVQRIHLHEGDILELKVDKACFNKDDRVDIQFKYREDARIYEDLLLVLLLAFLGWYAYKKGWFVSFTIAYMLYLLMLFAQQIGFGSLSFAVNAAYLFFASFFFFLYLLLGSLFTNTLFVTLIRLFVVLFIFAVPLGVVLYGTATHLQLSNDAYNALFQTNGAEALAYVQDMIPSELLLSALLYIVFLLYLLYKSKEEKIALSKETLALFFLFLVALYALFGRLSLFHFSFLKYLEYKKESKKFQAIAHLRSKQIDTIQATKKEDGQTFVVVIGESQNRHHMEMFGYFREDTPLLSEKKVLSFPFAYSNQVYTTAVLSYALTQANSYNDLDYYKAYSIVDIANRAGFETYWLTNQVLKGGWDNAISAIASQCDVLIGLNKGIGKTVNTQQYDEALLPHLRKILHKKTKKNRLVFIHLMGNHNRYSDRYPKKFEKYVDYLLENEFGNVAKMENITDFINSYDNSILYNDYVVNEILQAVEKEKGFVFYFADHSEGVDYHLAHTPDDFRYEMCDIPFFIYATKKFQKSYPKKMQNLQKNSNKLFNNAFVYDTLVGLMDIETSLYEKKRDISSNLYELEASKAFTLHGKKLYTAEDNYEYWKQKNIQDTHDENITLALKNVESFAQIFEAYHNGVKKIYIELSKKKGRYFIKNPLHDIALQDFLHFIAKKKMQIDLIVTGSNLDEKELLSLYGRIMFIVPLESLKQRKKRYAKRYILTLDTKKIHTAVMDIDTKRLKKMLKSYKKAMDKYGIDKLQIADDQAMLFQRYFGGKVAMLIVDTSANVCSKKSDISDSLFRLGRENSVKSRENSVKSRENSVKNIIFNTNYCTMYSQGKKYRSMQR